MKKIETEWDCLPTRSGWEQSEMTEEMWRENEDTSLNMPCVQFWLPESR